MKGSIAYTALKKEFEQLMINPKEQTGSIEYVGTAIRARGTGVATLLINNVIELEDYATFLIDEVASNNTPAIHLYEKIGFCEYDRKELSSKAKKSTGFDDLISYQYIKENIN